MRKIRKILALSLVLIMTMQSVTFAADFYDINDISVFIKQQGSDTCTLSAAAMMLRRAAILRGDSDWQNITESSIRSVAWYEGAGLRWGFNYNGMSVGRNALSGSVEDKTVTLTNLLKNHPEGIVLYGKKSTGGTHAVLLTDYTDGQFYCFDPSNGAKNGRIPLSEGLGVGPANANEYWYVSNANYKLDIMIFEENVEIQAEKNYMYEEDTIKLSAIVTPDNATHKEVTWTSSNESVATVDADGVVTGKAPGTANIIATTKGGKKAVIEISVFERFTGIRRHNDGNWYYYYRGDIQYDYSGLVRDEDNNWWYVIDGVLQKDYKGFVTNDVATWYVVGGKINTSFTGLGYDEEAGKWYGVIGGKVDMNYTGLVQNAGYFWYVENGVLNTDYKGFFTNDVGTWYVIGGKIDTSFTGLGYDGEKWLAVVNGRHYPYFYGLVPNGGSYWYVSNGELDTSYTGNYYYGAAQYEILNGKVIKILKQ